MVYHPVRQRVSGNGFRERAHVKKTTNRIVGFASCLFVALAVTVPYAAAPAYALNANIIQNFLGGTNNTTPTNNTGATGVTGTNNFGGAATGNTNIFQTLATNVLQGVTSGNITPTQGANTLAAASVPGANGQTATAGNFLQMFQGLSGNSNVNANSAIALFAGTASGAINPNVATSAASIPNLGNITSASGLTSAFSSMQGALSGLGNNTAMTNQVGQLAGLFTGNNASSVFSNPATTNSVASAVSGMMSGQGQGQGMTQQQMTQQLSQTLSQVGQQIGGQAGGIIGAVLGGLLGGGGGQNSSQVPGVNTQGGNKQPCASCCNSCSEIHNHYKDVRDHVTSEFNKHRTWFLTTYWLDNILPALMLMAEQLTVAGIHQVEMIGTLLDAKHQLETQRLMQEMSARAHKDYQPSEGMCTFGTTVRSLAASERKSDLAQITFSQRMNQRQVMAGDILSVESAQSDKRTRLEAFINNYCDKADNANGLGRLCQNSSATTARKNIDVDYTRNIESRLTLDVDILQGGEPTADEQDVFALAANLYSHNVAPRIMPEIMGDGQGLVRLSVMEKYMDLRAIFAKRSVAQNSFAAMAAMRASGDSSSAPYTKALMKELGIQDNTEIEKILGVNPSYFAQMEVLTKKLYQNPIFYTELYDKPANVERKGAALQAIGLMQDRDLYTSLLRSEAVLSVLLETMLEKEQEKVTNAYRQMEQAGGAR